MSRQVSKILNALKLTMRSKGITYKTLASKLGCSEPSVKRIFSTEKVSFERVEEICDIVGLSILELVTLSENQTQKLTRHTNLIQEEALANDPELFSVFYLLVSKWEPEKIAEYKKTNLTKIEPYLLKLDKLKLIELHPGNKIKLLIRKSIAWIPAGPVLTLYKEKIKNEFIDHQFSGHKEILDFRTWELSEATVDIFMKKLNKLTSELEEMAKLDEHLPKEQTRNIGFMMAVRPWTFSEFE